GRRPGSSDPDAPQRRARHYARGRHHQRRPSRGDRGVIIEVLTLFPELFPGPLSSGVTGRGLNAGLVSVRVHNLRDYTHDRHRQVDDVPYGGGPGMVLKPEPIFEAVRARTGKGPVILLSPQGELLNQGLVRELARNEDLYLVEYPHFTRPPLFEGHAVPEVLLSGHHAEIARWRQAQAVERTRRRRPDLLKNNI